MAGVQENLIYGLLIASVAFIVVPIAGAILKWIISSFSRSGRRKTSFNKKLVIFSAFLIGAVWCLRYAVSFYSAETADLTSSEKLFDSMIHALQTFSMDEDYTGYIRDGKEMLAGLAGSGSMWVSFYGLYASILNFAAPLAGGAILFEVLASIFPRIKLHIAYLAFWKPKYYFSELNERALTLAKSIAAHSPRIRKPTIIFTDVYVNDDDEKGSELLHDAKLLGAICIRGDVAQISKNKFGKRKYYLIDDQELGNLQTLTNLSDDFNQKYIKKSEIYLFSDNDLYTQVEKQVRDRLKNVYGFSQNQLPVIIPIQSYKNLVSNLLFKLPLYEPLIHKEKKDGKYQLTVTILGAGIIGTEMFLAVYWFGQMLDVDLTINVVSIEKKDSFWKKIDYINPEIQRSTDPGDPILKYRDDKSSEVYCSVNYIQADVKSGTFLEHGSEDTEKLLQTDYFMVALGSDEDNISVADKLRGYIGRRHIEECTKREGARKTIIAYVVYDSDLCGILNRKKLHCSMSEFPDIYMQAFGSLDEVYSFDNIYMSAHTLLAKGVDYAYRMVQPLNDELVQANENRAKREEDDYKYWANLSRIMHIKYKAFSLGWINQSVFGSERGGYDTEQAYARYMLVATGKWRCVKGYEKELEKLSEELQSKMHDIAWLEHRRWNAFTRTKGYRGASMAMYMAYSGASKSYKHMEMKLHPCLLECGKNGIFAEFDEESGEFTNEFQCKDRSQLDYLDSLSYTLYDLGINDYDFKKYDYPRSDFGKYYSAEETARKLQKPVKTIEKLCESKKIRNAWKLKIDDQYDFWLVSEKEVSEMTDKKK